MYRVETRHAGETKRKVCLTAQLKKNSSQYDSKQAKRFERCWSRKPYVAGALTSLYKVVQSFEDVVCLLVRIYSLTFVLDQVVDGAEVFTIRQASPILQRPTGLEHVQ